MKLVRVQPLPNSPVYAAAERTQSRRRAASRYAD